MLGLANALARDSAVIGVPVHEVERLSALAAQFDRALAAATSPATRTHDTIVLKDAAREQAKAAFRACLGQIKANPAVSVEVKLALGMKATDPKLGGKRRPIPAPTTAPLLTVARCTPGVHHMTYADSRTPHSRSKPHPSMSLHLYVVVHAPGAPPPGPDTLGARHVGPITKTPFKVEFKDPSQNGMQATYYGRWCTRTGLTGPWSEAASFMIAAGI